MSPFVSLNKLKSQFISIDNLKGRGFPLHTLNGRFFTEDKLKDQADILVNLSF